MPNRQKDGSFISAPFTEFGHENFSDNSFDMGVQSKIVGYNDMERRFKKADWGSGQKVKFQSNQAPQISRNIIEFDQKPNDGLKDTK